VSGRRYDGKAFHTQGLAAKKLLSPKLFVVCASNDTYPFGRGQKLKAASVDNEPNVQPMTDALAGVLKCVID